ncbi:MAG TPA: hypothetical protein VM347_42055, partial [Nonomuraea sp.]|nr:hypothetical protein [Nonomuraea sp.]
GIVTDLHQAGYLTRDRVGRRNHYNLNLDEHFRYPTEAGLPIRLLIDMFAHHDLPNRHAGQSPPSPHGTQDRP